MDVSKIIEKMRDELSDVQFMQTMAFSIACTLTGPTGCQSDEYIYDMRDGTRKSNIFGDRKKKSEKEDQSRRADQEPVAD